MKYWSCLFLMLHALMFSQTEQTINSGNSKLHYRTFGEGKPMLIINGGPGMNSNGFTYIAEALSKYHYQTITYDQRGTGKSQVEALNTKTITMDLMVQDIENLRTHLEIDQWAILGHSFGGILASYYALKHPEHVDRLIMSSSGGINMDFTSYVYSRQRANLTEIQKDSLAYFEKKQNNGDTSFEIRKGRAKYLAFAYVFDKSKAPIIAERLLQFSPEINTLVIQNLFKLKYDCSKKFKDFTKPVLIFQGENDIITVETAMEIEKAFPNSKLVLMKNCGHYGWLDAPEVYFSNIKSFLNS
ncbi:alpha/beta fold hydrolase [Flavobacterium sp.]|uniref:alpha/beta fold hydrolase n=1 Tax=Flavobacterium sp. TaxID=239 RepID=UPI002635A138|nr:alpha/beta fold hydrolase [Flavobacterium sp.]